MKKSKSSLFLILLASCLFCYGCGDGNNTPNNSPVNVEVQKVKEYDVKETIAYSGTIEETGTLPLSFSVMGTVLNVMVDEGEFVKKGQLLAKLNDETYKNTYEMSLAALTQAEDAYKRLKPMYENGNLPEIKYVEVESGLQQAKAAAAIAEKNVNDCCLYAPDDGYIGSRSIDPGMNVAPGIPAISIVKIEKVTAKVSVSESEISLIKKGQEAIIKIGALDDAEFEGKVREVGVMADPIAHTYKVKIDIPNPDKIIKPGMICDVMIDKPGEISGVVIPNRAVLIDESGRNFVYTVNEQQKTASRKIVVPGQLMKEGIEIKDGLEEGELVVTAGYQKLVDGSLVSIINR